MKTFKDTAGNEWRIALTVGLVDVVHVSTGLDLLCPHVGDPSPIQTLVSNNRVLLEVLGELLQPIHGTPPCSVTEIRDRFDGHTLGAAKRAFFEELSDFFQGLGDPGTARLVETAIEAGAMALQMAADQISSTDVRAELLKFASGYGSSPASPASIPGR